MEIQKILQRLKSNENASPRLSVWRGIFLRLNIYFSGIKPNYCIDKDDVYLSPSRREIEANEKYDDIFNNEIFCRYPHDTPAQLNFRKSIAHIDDMKSICDRFLQQSKSILFQGVNFKIKTEDKALQKWFEETRIGPLTFYEWVKDVLYPTMLVDPNALACVLEGHDQPFLSTEAAQPVVRLVGSEHVRYFDENVIVLKDRAIDQANHYKLRSDFEIDFQYAHAMRQLPAVQLGGQYIEPFVWHSFIQAFVGIANSYIQEKSDAVIAKKTLAPRLQIITSDCSTCNGKGKRETENGLVACGDCHGSGKISLSLGDVVSVPESRALLDDGKIGNIDRFKYTTPDPAYITLLNEDVNREFARAEKTLFIYRKETAASESGNNLDKQFEEKKIFFQAVADRLHYVVSRLVEFVSLYLNYNAGQPQKAMFEVIRPIDFDLTNAEDALLQYSSEKKNQLSTLITNNSELNYARKVFGEKSPAVKKLEFLQLYDPLYGKPEESLYTTQGLDGFDLATHNYLASLLPLYIAEISVDQFMQEPHSKTWEALKPRIEAKYNNLPRLV